MSTLRERAAELSFVGLVLLVATTAKSPTSSAECAEIEEYVNLPPVGQAEQGLDRLSADGVRFVFGYDASRPFVERAENVPDQDYEELVRKAHAAFADQNKKPRRKQPRIKEEVVWRRGFLNKKLLAEDTAEFEHRPSNCKKSYRIIVLRKLVQEDRGQRHLGTVSLP